MERKLASHVFLGFERMARVLCRSTGSRLGSFDRARGMHASSGETVLNVFDRRAKRKQRNRAVRASDSETYEYFKEEVAERVADRIFDVTRKFDVALNLGCERGYLAKHVTDDTIGTLYQCDMSEEMVKNCYESEEVPTISFMADEEFLPFKANSLDLVVSSLSLHWVNDLPGTFKQVLEALKEDGCFLAAMLGSQTLYELRCALQLAETEQCGGFSPRISPFTDVKDLGNLLTRAGFNMTTIDMDEIIVDFPSIFELLRDLKGMAENNAQWNRRPLNRDTLIAADAIYREMYANEDGSIPATFHILHFIGWKPAPSQRKPAKRGSATASFKDIDSIVNQPSGQKKRE